MRHIYASLDLGSNSLKIVVAEIFKQKFNVLAHSEIKCKGIKKGLIVSAEETILSLKELFSIVEDDLKMKITKIIVSIPVYNADFIKGEGYTTITREDGIINGDDIVRSLQASAYNKVPNDKELVSIMPLEFKVDDGEKVKDPKGMKGRKLSVVSVMGLTPKKSVYSVVKILESLGIDVVDITFNPIADYFAFYKKEYNTCYGAIINIGHEKTEVSIIHKGVLVNTEVIPLGGKNVDRDIAYEYAISLKDSRFLKENFGCADLRNASMSDFEEITTKEGIVVKINHYELSEIINKRVIEILELSKKQINLLTKKQISYIIITGGLTELKDFKLVYETVFGKNLVPNFIRELGIRHNKYSVSIGMIKYYDDKLRFRNKNSSMFEDDDCEELTNVKKKINNKVIEKIYEYFFDN